MFKRRRMNQAVNIVVKGTKRLQPADLVAKGRNHVRLIGGNPAYPDLQSHLPPIVLACFDLEKADLHYQFNKGRVDLVTRNAAYRKLRLLIDNLGAALQSCAHNDRELIVGAGFGVKQKRQPSQPMTAPPDLRAWCTEVSGRIKLHWGMVKNKYIYHVWYTTGDPNDPDGWQLLLMTSRNHHTADQLPSGVVHYFRVSALGVLGEGPLSDVALAKPA